MKLRVLHCIYDDPANPWVAGGGAVRVFELYRRLRDEVDVTVLAGAYPGCRNEVRQGVRYEHLGSPRSYAWSRWTYAREASRRLSRDDYDVAVFDFSAYTPLTIPTNRPVIVTVHHLTGPTAQQRWGRAIGRGLALNEQRMLRRAHWFTATSLATYAELKARLPAANIRLVQAGIPDDMFELRRADAGYVLYFGRLDWYQKGLDTLMQAASLLVRKRPDIALRIAGRGKDTERVMAEVARRDLSRNVTLLGPVDEPTKRSLLAGASLLLMPSRFEGFGMVAAEAMAAGVPVVATAAGSLPEVVSPPEGGALVPVGDAEALATAVVDLLDDPSRRERMSETARVSAERFRWQRVAEDHLAVLKEAAHHRTGTNERANG